MQNTKYQTTTQYSSERNGVTRSANNILVERTRTLFDDAKLDNAYYAEAANRVRYLKKERSPK